MTLNLVDIEKSDIKYKISKFPDGQQTVDLLEAPYIGETVQLISRLNSFKDLELIICATQAIRNFQHNKEISLKVPYFVGARSDRKFVEGGVNYLKQVICPIINSMNFKSVIVLDPHSDVLEACLNNFEKENNVFVSSIKNEKFNYPFISQGIERYKYDNQNEYISYGEWLAEPRSLIYFDNPKVIIREIINPRIFATYIDYPAIVKNIAAVIIEKDSNYPLLFFLALINSKLF